MKLQETDYWTIDYDADRGVTSLLWTEATEDMTDDDFKDALECLAGVAEDKRSPRVMVDIRTFRFPVGADIGPWREQTIVPRYNNAGIERFAYLTGPGGPPPRAPAKAADSEDFLTGFFDSASEAQTWLAGD